MPRIKLENSEITALFYPEDSKCGYCQGDYPIVKVKFEVILKNGTVIKPICVVCVGENILDYPHELDTIKNIGVWE